MNSMLKVIFFFFSFGIISVNYGASRDIPMIAHQGSWTQDRNPNTSEAYSKACEEGFYGVEGDLRYNFETNELYMSHDPVSNIYLQPSFYEYISICKSYDVTPVIDIKYSSSIKAIDTALKIVDMLNMGNKVIWQDSSNINLHEIRKHNPLSRAWYLVPYNSNPTDSVIEKYIDYAIMYGCEGVNVNFTMLNQNMINKFHQCNLDVCVYSLDDPWLRNKFLQMGVDYIMSNKK